MSPQPDEEPLEQALADCVSALEERGWESLDEVVDAHPGLETELRRRLESLRDWGLLRGRRPDGAETPRRLGDFRLLERIGGGGMGVVYRAHEEALGRDVALKVMRHEALLFEDARERFRREAEAVARLGHPGIVPIHRVGESDGVPFIAMELLDGKTADDAVKALRGRTPAELTGEDLRRALGADAAAIFTGDWPRSCVRLVLHVADALDHAHARGVLHRDVKPSNIVVTRAGRAMVVDFGLALTEGASKITMTGALVGSLPYLPAEAIEEPGRGWTERGDVYALGVTLYELLTLELPYHDTSAERTRRLIAAGRARRARELNPAIPRDLEAVCRVAMERDPGRRYPTMAELAQDLRNVLAGRPVAASPAGPMLRAWLWMRRRPAVACALFLALVLAIGVPISLLVQARRHAGDLLGVLAKETDARRAAQEAERRAAEEAARAEATLGFVVGMFKRASPYISRGEELSARDLVRLGAEDVRRRFRDDPATRAFVLIALGDAHVQLEKYTEGEELLREALDLLERHDPRSPERTIALVIRTQALIALKRLDDADALAASLAELGPPRADAALVLGQLASARRKWDEAQAHFERALERLREPDARDIEDEAAALSGLARVHLGRGELTAAIETSEEALALLREHLAPPHPLIARLQINLGLMLKRAGRLADAERHYRESLAASIELWGEESVTVAAARINLAGWHEAHRDYTAAIAELRRARPVLERALGSTHPSTVQCRSNLAGDLYNSGRLETAIGEYREIIPLQRTALGEKHPQVVASRFRLGNALSRTGHIAESLQLMTQITEDATDVGGAEYYVVLAWLVIASRRQEAGDTEGASRAFASGLAFADARADLRHPNVQHFLVAYLKFAKSRGDDETAGRLESRLASD